MTTIPAMVEAYAFARRTALRLRLPTADLDDYVQEGALAAYKALARLSDEYTPVQRQAYIARTVKNALLGCARALSRRRAHETLCAKDDAAEALVFGLAGGPTPEQHAIARETGERLLAAVETAERDMTSIERGLFRARREGEPLAMAAPQLSPGSRGYHLRVAADRVSRAARSMGLDFDASEQLLNEVGRRGRKARRSLPVAF